MEVLKYRIKDPHAVSNSEIARTLQSDFVSGLSFSEAEKRNEEIGLNVYGQKKQTSILRLFAEQFKSPIVYLLLIGAGISFYFKDHLEGIAILMVIFINAMIGFLMELQARNSMKALKEMDVSFTKVIREGRLQEIRSENITVGDIVYVEAGDVVPADGRVFESNQLQTDEAPLTGESLPVEKLTKQLSKNTPLAEQVNMAFKGTSVIKGNGKILITGIGMYTELGKITSLVESSEDVATPLDKKLNHLTKKLIGITIIIAAIYLGSGLVQGESISTVLKTAIALAVAAIPEGLPIVATIALAYGMLRMARRNTIVKKLSAVETLGGTSVILTDKTGTLTENKIDVNVLFLGNRNVEVEIREGNLKFVSGEISVSETKNFNELLLVSVLCNNAEIHRVEGEVKEVGDPLEVALIKFVEGSGNSITNQKSKYPRLQEEAFSSESKIMATLNKAEGELLVAAKGSVEHILNKCSQYLKNGIIGNLSPEEKQNIISLSEELSGKGLRVLAFASRREKEIARTNFSNNLVFVGLIGFLDPPRFDIKPSMISCREAGIRVVMVTGDHPKTAVNIAQKVGLIGENSFDAITGMELPEEGNYSTELKEKVLQTSVLARVTPKQKLDLVSLYQAEGNIVAMTGDGVNDAPALKKADIGIAMGLRGTQVAKETADIVLKDDSFTSIAAAVAFGRVIFQNIQKFVLYLISCNLSEVFIVTILGIVLPASTLLPLQILFINVITDVFPALALGMGEENENIMKFPPRNPKLPIITNQTWNNVFIYSAIICIAVFSGVMVCHYYLEMDAVACNNVAFFSLAIAQLWHVFNMSSPGARIISNEITRNKYVWIALFLCFTIISSISFIPVLQEVLNIRTITFDIWCISTVISLIPLVCIQVVKKIKGS